MNKVLKVFGVLIIFVMFIVLIGGVFVIKIGFG